MAIVLDQDRLEAFRKILPAIAEFKKAFGRDISPDFIAELYAACEFGLELPDTKNEPGADAVDPHGVRYQIKYRSSNTLNVDLNSFDFDYLVLVNLDEHYHLLGMWRLPVEKARTLFTFREKFRKYQATQDRVKDMADRVL